MADLTRGLLAIVAVIAIGAAQQVYGASVEGYRVVERMPHPRTSYTEGFLFLDGLFYEGTGLNGHSGVIATEPTTGRVVRQVQLAPQFFGEGIVDWGPYLYEWTWQSHVCLVYERATLRYVKQFAYAGEGWGMTRNERGLVTSDGSAMLTFRDPETFRPTRRIAVRDGDRAIDNLNELEWVKGEIYANVWHTDRIARISPKDGRVLGWIDLTGLMPASERVDAESVLNGIAYDAKRDRLFVTGKQWPAIFEIGLVRRRVRRGKAGGRQSESNGNGQCNSRSPSGMITRKQRTVAGQKGGYYEAPLPRMTTETVRRRMRVSISRDQLSM